MNSSLYRGEVSRAILWVSRRSRSLIENKYTTVCTKFEPKPSHRGKRGKEGKEKGGTIGGNKEGAIGGDGVLKYRIRSILSTSPKKNKRKK